MSPQKEKKYTAHNETDDVTHPITSGSGDLGYPSRAYLASGRADKGLHRLFPVFILPSLNGFLVVGFKITRPDAKRVSLMYLDITKLKQSQA